MNKTSKHSEVISRLTLAALVLVMIGILWYCYEFQLEAQFFREKSPQSKWQIIFTVSVYSIIPCIWLPLQFRRPSDMVVCLVFIFVYCSSALALSFSRVEGSVVYMAVLCLCMLVMNLSLRARRDFRLKIQPTNGRNYIIILVSVIGIISMVIYFQLGFQRVWIDLGDVYSIRDGSRARYSTWLDFMMRWLGYALLPVAISIGVYCRLYWLWGVCFLIYYYLYVTTGYKTFLFAGIVIICFNHAGWLLRGNFTHRLVALMIVITLLFLFIKQIFDTPVFLDLWVRRCFVVPGHLTSLYYEFFSTNPKFQFSTSGFLEIFNFNDRFYQLEIPNLIGLDYFGTEKWAANTNLWADAYANHGYVLMLIVSILLAIVLRFIDLTARGLSPKLVAPILIMPSVTITNSSLIPVLLGHGLLLVYCLLLLMPRSPLFIENNQHRKIN